MWYVWCAVYGVGRLCGMWYKCMICLLWCVVSVVCCVVCLGGMCGVLYCMCVVCVVCCVACVLLCVNVCSIRGVLCSTCVWYAWCAVLYVWCAVRHLCVICMLLCGKCVQYVWCAVWHMCFMHGVACVCPCMGIHMLMSMHMFSTLDSSTHEQRKCVTITAQRKTDAFTDELFIRKPFRKGSNTQNTSCLGANIGGDL